MKNLLFITAIFFASCSSDDPKPQFDCDKLQSEANQAHAAWQVVAKNPISPNATPQAKEEYINTHTELKNAYIEKAKLVQKHCK